MQIIANDRQWAATGWTTRKASTKAYSMKFFVLLIARRFSKEGRHGGQSRRKDTRNFIDNNRSAWLFGGHQPFREQLLSSSPPNSALTTTPIYASSPGREDLLGERIGEEKTTNKTHKHHFPGVILGLSGDLVYVFSHKKMVTKELGVK